MMEKIKTISLAVLVLLSLVQSYFLAYSFPNLGAKVSTKQNYVLAEAMGSKEAVENVIFPEEIVLHFGKDRHTVLYPDTNFYNMIFTKRIQMREFKGFQRSPITVEDWSEIRANDLGVELRFDGGIPVSLLQKVLKLDGDLQFLGDSIDRIWIFNKQDRGEVRAYFFSSDGQTVYQSTQADLTVGDVQEYVGFGTYWTPYHSWRGKLYLPDTPIEAVEYLYGFESYTPEQMQHNLFSDPGTTKAIEDRSGSLIYTDGKRGLQIEQNGKWMSYTDPVAQLDIKNDLSENVLSAITYVNQHGGWVGTHQFVGPMGQMDGNSIVFQQYHNSYPVIGAALFRFGQMRLQLQQGVVEEYERSLVTLGESKNKNELRWLDGGAALQKQLDQYDRRSEVISVFPALQASLTDKQEIRLEPIWAVRLSDGSQHVLMQALPKGTKEPDDLPKLSVGSADIGKNGSASGNGGSIVPEIGAGTFNP